MTIRRGPVPADNFTIIDNAWLRDPALSLKAKGLLVYIASHATGYALTMDQMTAESKDKIDAIRSGVEELTAAGYLRRVEVRDERGHRTGTDYELTDPHIGKSQVGKSGTSGNQGEEAISAGQPHIGKSQVGKSDPKKTTSPKKTNEKTPSASPRGTRLPEGWMPTPEMIEWAKAEAPGVGWREHEIFVDYWRAAPGQKGVKVDWVATWRNWMRKESDQRGSRPVSGAPVGQYKSAAVQNKELQDSGLEIARMADKIHEDRGVPMEDAYAAAKELHQQGFRPESLVSRTAVPYSENQIMHHDAIEGGDQA